MGYIRRFKLMNRRLSHETIYQYIWLDKADGGSLWRYLRQSPKRRRKRYKAYDSRGRLANKRNISERPNSVETRRYKRPSEIDTVHGRGSNRRSFISSMQIEGVTKVLVGSRDSME